MNRKQIRQLIPHDGAMCLLDGVAHWDTQSIHCHSRSHRNPDHPLRRKQRLSAIHLIEYAAQAAGLHHGLVQRQQSASGVKEGGGALVALREIELEVEELDSIREPLQIHATNVLSAPSGLVYRFHVETGGRQLSSGQLSIVTNVPTEASVLKE